MLPVESWLYVKLMSPIYVEVPKVAASVPQVPQPVPQALAPVSTDSLDVLVAPAALYPDAILGNLLRASTRPFEIVQANQWVHQNRDSAGSLPSTGYNENWDPSVKALTGYPDLLLACAAAGAHFAECNRSDRDGIRAVAFHRSLMPLFVAVASPEYRPSYLPVGYQPSCCFAPGGEPRVRLQRQSISQTGVLTIHAANFRTPDPVRYISPSLGNHL